MIISRDERKIPLYFGTFIIGAMVPQILGFNGTTIDTIYKLALMALLLLIVMPKEGFFCVSPYFFFFVFINIIGFCAVALINDTDISLELQNLIIRLLLLYLFYECVLKVYDIRTNDVESFYRVIVYFMLMASIYNMMAHFNSFIHFTSLTLYSSEEICSFFDNKNTFGVFLLFGVLASTILKILTNQLKWSAYAVIFLINEMMAMCRTAIILSLILVFVSFFVDKRQRQKSIFLALVLIIVVVIALRINSSFNSFIYNNLFGNSYSFDVRNSYIENMLPLAKGEHFMFGYGVSRSSELAAQYAGNQYYHNTYLKELISGGIFKVGIQISAIVLSYVYGFRCRSNDIIIGSLCILSTTIYVVYSNFESVALFDSPVIAMMAVMFIISLPILFYNSFAFSEIKERRKI